MVIRKSTKQDIFEIEKVHSLAFGEDEGPVIVELAHNLFKDKSAEPYFSLVAVEDEKIVGHILFTKVVIGESKTRAQILAPMAVLPDYQGKGIGGKLIQEGLRQLKKLNIELVFVLGYPNYYSRFGFKLDAKRFGYEAPYLIDEKNKDAWMVQWINTDSIGQTKGKIKCADELNKEKYWVE